MCFLPNARSRFEEFSSLRNNARALRNLEEMTSAKASPLLPRHESKQAWNPSWLRAMEQFSGLEKIVTSKIETLIERQQSFFSPNFFSDEDEVQIQNSIDSLISEIRKLLRELERMALSEVNPHHTYRSDELMIHNNVKRYLCSRLKQVGQTFKNAQDLYVRQLQQRLRKKQRYMKFGSDETHEIIRQEEKSIPLFEMGYSQADIEELMKGYEKDERINVEVKQIIDTVQEIHHLFEGLNALVVEQGEILDRIDCSNKWASDHTLKGKEALKKAQESQGSHCVML